MIYQFSGAEAHDLHWVSKARSKEKDRETICNRIHIESGKAIASDGHVLFVSELFSQEAIPDGDYQVVVAKPNQVILETDQNEEPFPPWSRLFPQDDPIARGGLDGQNIEVSFIKFLRGAGLYIALPYKQLIDALDGQTATITIYDEARACLIEYDNRKALIMPFDLHR